MSVLDMSPEEYEQTRQSLLSLKENWINLKKEENALKKYGHRILKMNTLKEEVDL